MFSRLRSILRHSRVPITVDSANHASNVYRVRFLRPVSKERSAKFSHIIGLTLLTAVLGARVVQVMSLNGQPAFIPLGFAKQESPRPFKKDDPEVRAFLRFGSDRARTKKARRVFEDRAVQILQKSLSVKIGTHIRDVRSMLYFHYPQGPTPGFRQNGLQFVYRPRDPTAVNLEDRSAVIEINYTERHIKPNQYLRRETILYPRWMFYAVRNSLLDIWADITSPRHPDEAEIGGVADLIQYGVDLSQWTLANLKDDLTKTKTRLPPPSGHVIIDGIVQVTTNRMLITVDLTGSFNPENPEQAAVHRMTVRFFSKLRPSGGRTKKQAEPAALEGPLGLGRAVVSGLKEDIKPAKEAAAAAAAAAAVEAAAVAAANASATKEEGLEEQKQRKEGGEKPDLEMAKGSDIVDRLVKSNAPVGNDKNMLDGGDNREHASSRQAADAKKPPPRPPRPSESQSPPSPRE